MRWLALLLAFIGLGSCKTGSAPSGGDEVTHHTGVLATDEYKPSYGMGELDKALADERTAEAAAEARVQELEDKGNYDELRLAIADLAVRRRFVASLAACKANGVVCPPRLDDPAWSYDVEANVDPTLDVKLRFDLESWQKVAAELHGRACACRTLACVDSMFAAIDRLEVRPMSEVQSDETASLSITRARECLYRLRGLRRTPRAVATD
jgi:hypothetical protein